MAFINGIDCDHYPGDSTMALLRARGQFRVTCLYLAHVPGSQDKSWIAKRDFLANNGWGFIPTYVGAQNAAAVLDAPTGKLHAGEAASLMEKAGFAASSIVCLDMESGDVPASAYADYVSGWIDALPAAGFTPAVYCSHLVVPWALKLTKFVWSFHIPLDCAGNTYDPANLPPGAIDPDCIATQYLQKIKLKGIPISAQVDSEGFDLNLCTVPDPSNLAVVQHSLMS